jgi:hypothetical protein
VAGVHNKHAVLRKTLPTWLAVDGVVSVLIVDWGSTIPVRDTISRHPKLRIIRVQNETRWCLSRAINLAVFYFQFTEKILKLDADFVLETDFVRNHPLHPGMFYAGNYKMARNENEKHLNGLVYLWRSDFIAVNGYDERIVSYGWEDDDLYSRLTARGLIRMNANTDRVRHEYHSDNERTGDLGTLPDISILCNRFLLEQLPSWSAQSRCQYGIVDSLNGFSFPSVAGWVQDCNNSIPLPDVIRRYCAPSLEDLGTSMRQNATTRALRVVLQSSKRLNDSIIHQLEGSLLEFVAKLSYNRLNERPALIIDAQYGIANRMCAIASAIAIANATNRQLVVVWSRDDHIRSSFSELFQLAPEMIHKLVILENFPIKDLAMPLGIQTYNYMENEVSSIMLFFLLELG